MASLDSLPGDQRAVLGLVLGRGRSYEEIARLLSIDPAAVRQRALAALDALGPQTKVAPEHRGMIADYLLGQLPESDAMEVRNRLADSASERAWARVVSSELAPLASSPLAEIPVSRDVMPAEAPAPEAPLAPDSGPDSEAESDQETGPATKPTDSEVTAAGEEAPGRERGGATGVPVATAAATDAGTGDARTSDAPASDAPAAGGARSSRVGGALLIGVAVLIVAAVLFLVLRGGSSNKHPTASAPTSSTAAAASSTTPATATSTTSAAAKVISQINLTPPAAGSKAAGVAEVLREGTSDGIAIVAQDIPPNTKSPPNAYAVWLYNSPSDAHILGFVNPSVGSNGRLSTAGGLPANAAHYKNLIVTVETTASPKVPGTIVLQGALTGL